jgi:uncharacterized protein (TIGR02246 family)
MAIAPRTSGAPLPDDDGAVRLLYRQMLNAWNRADAAGFAALCEPECHVVGFDGSQHNGRLKLESHLTQVFAGHKTAAYVAKVREVTFLAPHVAVLRAVTGMVPPGQSDINPAVNAVQTLVATRHRGQWHAFLFQNTPAALHGTPELSEQLSEELREVLRSATSGQGAPKP